jgi:hypothetical protein
MLIGPSSDATLLEVGVVLGSGAPVIIHAMRAPLQYLTRG